MTDIPIREAAQAINGLLKANNINKTINRIFTDSRAAGEDSGLFFALLGEKTDGHIFVNDMTARGSFAVVSDKKYHIENTILVENTKNAVYDLAAYYRNKYLTKLKVVAVTGSVGKTTTKDMLNCVFASRRIYATKGNRNSLVGVPLSVSEIEAAHEFAILELGMSEKGEIARLSNLVRPDISIITSIGTAHIEAFGSIGDIRDEKFDITSGMDEKSVIILNSDDELMLSKDIDQKKIYCGIENDCDFRAMNITEFDGKTSFDILTHNNEYRVVLNLAGRHNIYNALYAFAAGYLSGIDPVAAAASLSDYAAQGNRQNIYDANGIKIIADCYNASPESMYAALEVLKNSTGRRIAVLGDMLELGKYTEQLHRSVGEKAAECADILVFIGESAAEYKNAAKRGYLYSENEKDKAADLLKTIVKKGDSVLFKASNKMRFEDIIKGAGLCMSK